MLNWIAIACATYAAPVSGADAPQPTIYIVEMLDGSVQLEGERYSQPDSLRVKLAEIIRRNPPPALRLSGETGPCWSDPFKAARGLLVEAGFLKSDIVIEDKLCGPPPLRPVPVAALLLPKQEPIPIPPPR